MGTGIMMTIEQFLQLPDEELRRHELWQGELVEVGDTVFSHNWIRDTLRTCISLFLAALGIGGEVLVETGIQFDTNTLSRPDLAYWDAEHLVAIDWERSPVEVVPQLVVEIVSPSNSLRELFRRAEHMIRSGVHVVWIFSRNPWEVHVFEKGKAKRVLGPDAILEAPTVLPGFAEKLAQFMPPKK